MWFVIFSSKMYLFENWKETYLSYRGKINYASNREAIRLIIP